MDNKGFILEALVVTVFIFVLTIGFMTIFFDVW